MNLLQFLLPPPFMCSIQVCRPHWWRSVAATSTVNELKPSFFFLNSGVFPLPTVLIRLRAANHSAASSRGGLWMMSEISVVLSIHGLST